MNGIWKENLSGYDRKGQKRKRTTRKNIIRDKAKALIKHFDYLNVENYIDTDNYRNESLSIAVFKPIPPSKPEFADIYSIKLSWEDFFSNQWSMFEEAYFKDGLWYDINHSEVFYKHSIYSSLTSDIEIVKKLKNVQLKYNDNNDSLYKKRNIIISTGETFIYDKPFASWEKWKLYSDGKRRKIAQKLAHHKDRQYLKQWVKKQDWDSNIKTHPLSKSILWEVW